MNLKEFGFTDINHELLQQTNTPTIGVIGIRR